MTLKVLVPKEDSPNDIGIAQSNRCLFMYCCGDAIMDMYYDIGVYECEDCGRSVPFIDSSVRNEAVNYGTVLDTDHRSVRIWISEVLGYSLNELEIDIQVW